MPDQRFLRIVRRQIRARGDSMQELADYFRAVSRNVDRQNDAMADKFSRRSEQKAQRSELFSALGRFA